RDADRVVVDPVAAERCRRPIGDTDAGSVDVVALDDAPEGRRDVEAGAGGGDLVARDTAAGRSQQREAAPTAAEVAVAQREARGAATGDGERGACTGDLVVLDNRARYAARQREAGPDRIDHRVDDLDVPATVERQPRPLDRTAIERDFGRAPQ